MNYSKNWSLFLIVFVLVLTVFFLSTTSWFESYDKKTTASIVDDYVCYGIRGRGYYQCIVYAYVADGKLYKAVEKIEGRQQIGNTLEIQYAVDNPNSTEILSYNYEYSESKEEAFIHLKEKGYLQITLINGVYFFKDFGEGGKLILEEMGKYEERSDTLYVKTFLEDTSRTFVRMKNGELLDVSTNELYK